MQSVRIKTQDGRDVIQVRVPAAGKQVAEILQVLESKRLLGSLEIEGDTLTASDVVFPGEAIIFKPVLPFAKGLSALPVHETPVLVRPSKKQKVDVLRERSKRVILPAILGDERLDVLACLNWLGLHLSEDSEVDLMSTTDEKRYYPYVLPVVRAAAAGSPEVEVKSDVQVSIAGKVMFPVAVKKVWGHGSVDDPDGISRNSEDLEQVLNQVLALNAWRSGSYTCVAAIIIRVHYILFFKFHISKQGVVDRGRLELLEFAPGFPKQGGGIATTAKQIELVPLEGLINQKWSKEPLEKMDLSEGPVPLLKRTRFCDILSSYPPEGFHCLVQYFRKFASLDLRFIYDSREGEAYVGEVLASGAKSCVIATKEGNSVLKVSSDEYIKLDFHAHKWVDEGGNEFLRKMVGSGYVQGAASGLRFIELEGLGIPWACKHVWDSEGVEKCWKQASMAVKALHAQKVFHRDIKPDNFIVLGHGTESQRLVLNDLDCAVQWTGDLTADVGTPFFKSPKLLPLVEYCCRDDWLSLGLSFAFVMGLLPEGDVNAQVKLRVLSDLVDHKLAPEDMKVTLEKALQDEDVCCYRVPTVEIFHTWIF